MYCQDSLTTGTIRERDGNLTIKATWTQQSLIKNVNPICSCHDHDRLTRIEPIQFYQELVERLVAFVIASYTHRAFAANGIKFIQEDDTGGSLTRLCKKIAHSTGSNTHEHLNKFR